MQKGNLMKLAAFIMLPVLAFVFFVFAKQHYSDADFGNTFGTKAASAESKLLSMKEGFQMCASLCNSNVAFMQAMVFPEVMRYNGLKDDMEAESLKVLYVQFGKEYANFSVGIFQMKPSFAEEVEAKAKQLLPAGMYNELQLGYTVSDAETVRSQRLKRLLDEDWQMIYLTAFHAICDSLYTYKNFSSASQKLQWYATVYNAGFDRTAHYIEQKIAADNFYLSQRMPEKKFKYAAIATWYYEKYTALPAVAK